MSTETRRGERRAGYERKYHDNPANKGKHYARGAVFKALESGELTRALSCESCGDASRLEAHHADYSKPLDVKWLCIKCHRTLHLKTHCKHGHAMTEDNIYVWPNSEKRSCRTCRTNRVRKFRERATEQITGADSAAVHAAKALVGESDSA